LETKRVVITGGPGSGKTALINLMEKEGHSVMHEVSREIIKQAKKKGIDQLFLENPMLFSEMLLEGRIEQYKAGEKCDSKVLFYDRGIPDVTAYLDFAETSYPEVFSEKCQNHRYDTVFVLPPWEDIYEQDDERYESFEQAEKIFHFLKKGYEDYGYITHEVPVGTIKQRVDYILETIKNLS